LKETAKFFYILLSRGVGEWESEGVGKWGRLNVKAILEL